MLPKFAGVRSSGSASVAIDAIDLSKRYGRRWALQQCSIEIPEGHVVGLVGANGAGKSTLLRIIVGLLRPSAGTVTVLGHPPAADPAQLARVGFLAQDAPLFGSLSVEDHLRLGRHLNMRWDGEGAAERIRMLELDLDQRAGTLSGGERAQLALTLALAKRPEILILDEPVAGLDPLARRDFVERLMAEVAEHHLTVVLSSHLLSDIEKVSDHLIVMASSRVRVAGDIATLLASHRLLTGPHRDPLVAPGGGEVIDARHHDGTTTMVVRTDDPVVDPDWTTGELDLEQLVLAYLAKRRAPEATAS
ncbi:MAG: transporter, ATP-binding protein [Acidimicrobiales bacterium]|jgi:ABC-2 type transport system ATP-binding protein|nr:transporter, ATP-binding protein [Acidimicrobiales bacterium]